MHGCDLKQLSKETAVRHLLYKRKHFNPYTSPELQLQWSVVGVCIENTAIEEFWLN